MTAKPGQIASSELSTIQDNESFVTANSINSAFEAATGRWTGCDWPKKFGPLRLELQPLKSNQALLLAEATAGEEAKQWRAAAAWLAQVEKDARAAEFAARSAVTAAQRSDWSTAERHAETARSIEVAYRKALIWNELLIVIQQAAAFHAEHEDA